MSAYKPIIVALAVSSCLVACGKTEESLPVIEIHDQDEGKSWPDIIKTKKYWIDQKKKEESKVDYVVDPLEPMTVYAVNHALVLDLPDYKGDVVANVNKGDAIQIDGLVESYKGDMCLWYKLISSDQSIPDTFIDATSIQFEEPVLLSEADELPAEDAELLAENGEPALSEEELKQREEELQQQQELEEFQELVKQELLAMGYDENGNNLNPEDEYVPPQQTVVIDHSEEDKALIAQQQEIIEQQKLQQQVLEQQLAEQQQIINQQILMGQQGQALVTPDQQITQEQPIVQEQQQPIVQEQQQPIVTPEQQQPIVQE